MSLRVKDGRAYSKDGDMIELPMNVQPPGCPLPRHPAVLNFGPPAPRHPGCPVVW